MSTFYKQFHLHCIIFLIDNQHLSITSVKYKAQLSQQKNAQENETSI